MSWPLVAKRTLQAFVVAIWLLQLAGAPLPGALQAVMDRLTSLDLWIINTFPSPGLFALTTGLVIGIVIIPALAAPFRRLLSPAEPAPDFPAHEAFRYLHTHSKYALWQDMDGGNLTTRIEMALREAARQGRVRVWGRRLTESYSGLKNPRDAIPRIYWDNAAFDITTCWRHPEQAPRTVARDDEGVVYTDVAFNRHEVRRAWPPAFPLFLWFDSKRKTRDNVAFELTEPTDIEL